MARPVISIIMPVYNGERFLADAVNSIRAQTYGNFEFLIVDDGSTDDTAQIVHSVKDPRIRYFHRQPHEGASAARNFALAQARGIYLTGMDADDVSLPDRLERQVAFLESRPSVGLVACGWETIDEHGRPLFTYSSENDRAPINSEIDWQPCLLGATYFFRTECINKVGVYRAGFDMNEDWDLCVRIGEAYDIGILGGVSYQYREHSLAACSKKVAKNIRSIILVRRLASERRQRGADRLSTLSEAKMRRLLRLYFHSYDRYESAARPLRYFQLAHRILKNGGNWNGAARYLFKGIACNPLRLHTIKLTVRFLLDKQELKRLGRPPTVPSRHRAC